MGQVLSAGFVVSHVQMLWLTHVPGCCRGIVPLMRGTKRAHLIPPVERFVDVALSVNKPT